MTKRLEKKVDMLLGIAKDLDQKVDYLIESRKEYYRFDDYQRLEDG